MSETDPGADAAGRDYFTAVETEFIRRRGSPFLLSAKDFALIRRWRELGIPVADVCLGISESFDRRLERGALSRINSVSYCEGAVLEAWERNSSARVGKAPASSEDLDTALELEALAGALAGAALIQPAAADSLIRAERSVRKLQASGRLPEQIEGALSRLERKLFKEIIASLPGERRRSIEEETDRKLAGDRETMESRAFEKTREILIRRKLRAELGIPRLTLLG